MAECWREMHRIDCCGVVGLTVEATEIRNGARGHYSSANLAAKILG